MVKEIRYMNIRRVLSDLVEHPMLTDLTLEQAVRHTMKFMARNSYPQIYNENIADVEIHDFRGILPCDLISIKQVKDLRTGVCLVSMTDSFPSGMLPHKDIRPCVDPMNNVKMHTPYIPPLKGYAETPSFKTQGNIIYTSFPEGVVGISYKSIPVDDDGFPMLVDNELYIDALEKYIKMQVFEVKFDQQKITAAILQNAQQQYYAAAKLLQGEFTIPSPSEMESMARVWNTLIPKIREFDNGFKNLNSREYLRKQ